MSLVGREYAFAATKSCRSAKVRGPWPVTNLQRLHVSLGASGWTECVAMPPRKQLLVVQGMANVSSDLLFLMLGVDTDNDSAFMNQTVHPSPMCAIQRRGERRAATVVEQGAVLPARPFDL